MARATVLSKGTLLPAIVQHIHTARSGFVKADGSALLVAFLRSSKVHLQSLCASLSGQCASASVHCQVCATAGLLAWCMSVSKLCVLPAHMQNTAEHCATGNMQQGHQPC